MEIDVQSRVPIYEQIVNHLRQQILYGELKPAEKLPSIRLLAKKLQVNPNTIKKSYQILEKQQFNQRYFCNYRIRTSFRRKD